MGSSRNQPQGNLRTFDIFGEVEICVLSGLCRDDSYPPTYFTCRRTLLNKLIPRDHIHGSEREIKFRRCLFTFSMKREISHFYVVVLQKGQRNVQKSVMHVQRVLLCLLIFFFFLTFSLRSRCCILKSPGGAWVNFCWVWSADLPQNPYPTHYSLFCGQK